MNYLQKLKFENLVELHNMVVAEINKRINIAVKEQCKNAKTYKLNKNLRVIENNDVNNFR